MLQRVVQAITGAAVSNALMTDFLFLNIYIFSKYHPSFPTTIQATSLSSL